MKIIKNFVSRHPDLFIVLGLGVLFYLIFFHNIWAYALMDVDESRYVTMAKDMFRSKDFLTLYLNNEYFFEKPPLFFWSECLSFKIFGVINEFTARFPVAFYGMSCCYIIYFIGKKIISRGYGAIAAIIMATSFEYSMLAKFAILDIVVSTFITFSIFAGLVVYFCRENRKKYYWWLFYFFSGLAVMAKGLPGVIIPFGAMFFIALISKKINEIFKPINIIPGLIIFLLITLPWHIIMFKMYNPLFWDEYIVKHHLARFLGSEVINREQPFYFYFLTLLWGFFPWVISCLSVWISQLIDCIKSKKYKFDFDKLSTPQKFLLYNIIIALFIILFFSTSGTKLITYILPIYAPLACLGAYIWLNYITKSSKANIINPTIYFLGGVLIFASIACIFTPLYLPEQLFKDISTLKTFCMLTTFATGLGLILFTKKRLYIAAFAILALFMAILSAIATERVFEIDYKFGQDDLMKFAKYAKENNVSLTTFNFGKKYSLLFYGEVPVTFKPEHGPELLQDSLDDYKNMVIIQNRDIKYFNKNDFDIIQEGRKYSLVEEKNKR